MYGVSTVAVTMSLETTELTVSEGACYVNVTIQKEGETTVDSQVILNTIQSGTAVGKFVDVPCICSNSDILYSCFSSSTKVGEDFLLVETEVTFSPTESRKIVTIPLVNDNVQELREWFVAELDLPVGQVGVDLGSPAVANITIVDDDGKWFYTPKPNKHDID